MNYIEFTINGVGYWACQHTFNDLFSFSNDKGEDGKGWPTLLDAQQDAINWEATRKVREEDFQTAEAEARSEEQANRLNFITAFR